MDPIGQAGRVDAQGMDGLFAADARLDSKRLVAPNIRGASVRLKAEYPPLRPNELARICFIHFNSRLGARIIEWVLVEEPSLAVIDRRFPPYAESRVAWIDRELAQ